MCAPFGEISEGESQPPRGIIYFLEFTTPLLGVIVAENFARVSNVPVIKTAEKFLP